MCSVSRESEFIAITLRKYNSGVLSPIPEKARPHSNKRAPHHQVLAWGHITGGGAKLGSYLFKMEY